MNKVLTTKKGTELPLINLKGKDYLQVMYRLVWLREEKPLWSIETEFIKLEETFAICKATVKSDNGTIISTSHKREDKIHFPDFIEKAETGSIGRALALVGYGTQFEPDLDEGERIVDSPAIQKDNSWSMKQFQPTTEEIGHGFKDGIYRVPSGTHKGRTIEKIFEMIGKEELEKIISRFEERIKLTHLGDNVPYSGYTIKSMQEFVDEASSFIIQFENQGDDFNQTKF